MRKLKIVLGSLLFLAAAGAIGLYVFFRLPLPSYTGTEILNGLAQTVTVRTDDHGIPHIFAQNEADLFFAQGYITARERMFQMDVSRLAGRGELSRLFGEATLEKDRFLKTVGFYRRAQAVYAAMDPATRQVLDAYTAGVNAYIDTMGHRPREYVFLRAAPMKWESPDSVAVALLLSYSLTRSKKIDLALYQLGVLAGKEVLDLMAPRFPFFAPSLKKTAGLPAAAGQPPPPPASEAFGDTLAAEGGDLPEVAASNWIIFGGSRTTTGKPIFYASPDLAPTLPALFYITRLNGGRYDVMGGAVPGVPGIGPLGFNGYYAWSCVNGRGDELDYFIEKPDPDAPDRYLTESGPVPFEIIRETLAVKRDGRIVEEPLVVRATRHGPIVSDVLPMAPALCAMKWVAMEGPFTDLGGLLAMNRARSIDAFRSALGRIRNMNLGFGYADKDGNIGWQFTASPPIRRRGDGRVPVPGWSGDYEWTGIMPVDDLPHAFNPPSGVAAAFNNDPGDQPAPMTNYNLFERAIRFEQILTALGDKKVSAPQIKAFGLDTVSPVAVRWMPLVTAACRGKDALAAPAAMLAGWDLAVTVDSPEATLFNLFYLLLMKNTLADQTGLDLWEKSFASAYLYYVPDRVLATVAADPAHWIYDDAATASVQEDRDTMIRKSLAEAWLTITVRWGADPENWRWGRVHRMTFAHPMGKKLPFLNLAPLPVAGDHHTINAGFWDNTSLFDMNSGGVIRMMVDFSDLDNATIISPPGQSGHFMSPYYDDVATIWAGGDQVPMGFYAADGLTQSLVLRPGR